MKKSLLMHIIVALSFLSTFYISMISSIFYYGGGAPWYIRIPKEIISCIYDFTDKFIYENFLITDEEIIERKLKKSIVILKDLSSDVMKFHEVNRKILTSIDELEPVIKEEYSKISDDKNKTMDYEQYLQRRIYDEFGGKFYVDSQSYEIYCINPDVINKIYKKIHPKNEYTLSFINHRVFYDCVYIEKFKRQFINKEKRMPANISELRIDLPFEKWGMKYELGKESDEIIIIFPDGKSNIFRGKSLNIY